MGSFRKWTTILVTAAALAVALWVGLRRLEIDADLTGALPTSDPVVNDARYVLTHHPSLDRVYIDLSLRSKAPDVDRLVSVASRVGRELRHSGLFRRVGMDHVGEAIAGLYAGIGGRLPVLFSRRDLETLVAPRLEPARVTAAILANRRRLLGLEGIGQAQGVTRDPLGLRDLVMARLQWLRPSDKAEIRRRQLVTRDGRHLLIIAEPTGAGTDTSFARRLTALLGAMQKRLDADGLGVVVTPVGAYRAALDNETIIRRDTTRAMVIATLGIVLLLILCFPRPTVGLLALLPAGAGAIVALFVYSLISRKISALALGFGGALISITVDHGIAYLLFLHQEHRDAGRRAARQVWAVGLLAVVTTVGAFGALIVSGFPLLAQVGTFAALGVAASFGFVHVVFPRLFEASRLAAKGPLVEVDRLLVWLGGGRPWRVLGVAAALVAVLAFFVRPQFGADLQTMNTMHPSTHAAEKLMKRAWGDFGKRVWVLVEGRDGAELQQQSDRLAEVLDGFGPSRVAGAFSPSHVYPGVRRARANLAAWKDFWTGARRARVKRALASAAEVAGFTAAAFDPFVRQIEAPRLTSSPVPKAQRAALGITRSRSGGGLLMLAPVVPAAQFDGEQFGRQVSGARLRVFDTRRFTSRLATLISRTFVLMLLLVGVGVLVLLVVTLLDWRLVLLAITPLVFSLVCTLGTLKLLGRRMDIPGLMLIIVVVGMGLDYGLYFVRAHVRYLDPNHRGHRAVRQAVFLAGGSTLLGFGSLVFSDHAVLRSAGIVTSFGILYALVGAIVLLPPVLRRLYPAGGPSASPDAATSGSAPGNAPSSVEPGSAAHRRRVHSRFASLAAYPRLFAWFKVRLDPMFDRLAKVVPAKGLIIDVGCGFGVPAAWLLACRPHLRVVGVEPDLDRARISRWVLGDRGQVVLGRAEALALSGARAQAVLMADMVHHLDDEQLHEALCRARACLAPGGSIVIRATIPGGVGRWPWERRLEALWARARGLRCIFRTWAELNAALTAADLATDSVAPSDGDGGREETWLVASVVEVDHNHLAEP